MIALIQRVSQARVEIQDQTVAEIGRGILALIAIEKSDTQIDLERLTERLIGYRIFPDQDGKMNLGLKEIRGELLLVPQFTLAADTRKGNRPSFSSAAPPDLSRALFEQFVEIACAKYPKTACGIFAQDMQVSLTNDGPVTFWLGNR